LTAQKTINFNHGVNKDNELIHHLHHSLEYMFVDYIGQSVNDSEGNANYSALPVHTSDEKT